MATYSSILAWRSPWTEEPGGLQSIGSERVRHDQRLSMHAHVVKNLAAASTWFPYSRLEILFRNYPPPEHVRR